MNLLRATRRKRANRHGAEEKEWPKLNNVCMTHSKSRDQQEEMAHHYTEMGKNKQLVCSFAVVLILFNITFFLVSLRSIVHSFNVLHHFRLIAWRATSGASQKSLYSELFISLNLCVSLTLDFYKANTMTVIVSTYFLCILVFFSSSDHSIHIHA